MRFFKNLTSIYFQLTATNTYISSRFRESLWKLKGMTWRGTGECLAPSPPWCAPRVPGVFTMGWWLDSRDRWALPLCGLDCTTPWSSFTLKAQRVSFITGQCCRYIRMFLCFFVSDPPHAVQVLGLLLDSWPVAPREPWLWLLHSQQMWWRCASKPRYDSLMVRGDTTAPWVPTKPLPEMRVLGGFGKVISRWKQDQLYYLYIQIHIDVWTTFILAGCMPNITRNAIVNCAELVTYDIVKDLILKFDLLTGEYIDLLHIQI